MLIKTIISRKSYKNKLDINRINIIILIIQTFNIWNIIN